jgi:outer membrane protein assembly factor BamB
MTEPQVPDFSTITSPPFRTDLEFESVKDGNLIGSGGQSTVTKASLSGPEPPDVVAVKQPQTPAQTMDTAVIESFFDEAETWKKLAEREQSDKHRDTDHIVGIVAMGENLPWLAMEFMDGGNLADRLDSHPNGLPIDEALWIAECLCQGLKLAHDNGVAHLDLKPENVLFRETPGDTWDVPKIADWGLSRSLLADSQSVDVLSVEYAAPEQFDADEFGKPDSYTDIYQIGVVIYEMLTGELPYSGEQTEIMHSVIYGDEPDPPSSHREQLPPAVDDVILKTLSKEKPQRYRGSVDRLEDAIRDIRHSTDDSNTKQSVITKGDEEPETKSGTPRTSHLNSWPMRQGGPARTGYKHTTGPKSDIEAKWSFETDGKVDLSPAVTDGTVFVSDSNKRLYALNTNTGSKRWCFEADGGSFSSPTVVDETVLVSSGDSHLYAVDAMTGSLQWSYEMPSIGTSSPVVADSTVFVGCADDHIDAVDATTGTQKWSSEIGDGIYSAPAVVDGTVFVGRHGNQLYALDATTGYQQWSYETGTSASSPAVANGTVFIPNHDYHLIFWEKNHRLEAVEATTGSLKWCSKIDGVGFSSPAVAGGTVFVGSGDNNIYALDTATGYQRWSFETGDTVESSPAVVGETVSIGREVGETVYIGSNDNHLYALDASDGSQRWSFETGGAVVASPAVADDTVFVGSRDGHLYALSEKDQ